MTASHVVADTTVWIDYFGGREAAWTRWLDANLERERIAVADIILLEVLQGIRDDRSFDAVSQAMRNFEILSTGGVHLALASASNYRRLRQRGITVRKTIDCIIATLCIEQGHALLHNDRDFDPFEKASWPSSSPPGVIRRRAGPRPASLQQHL